MATAYDERELLARGEGCLAKAAADEPIFILRAQDVTFCSVLAAWIREQEARGTGNTPKVREARTLLLQASDWQRSHRQNVKVAD
jgi:hypothetical protein